LLRKGEVTVEILERITSENKSYGDTYSLRAKNVRAMYRQYYKSLASKIETPEYFADRVYHNYFYKGADVTLLANIDLLKHNNFTDIISHIYGSGNVLVFGAGIGLLPIMLSLVNQEIKIEAVENDEDKLALARNCSLNTERITYLQGNPSDFKFMQKYDAVVLMDCLSVYEDAEQRQILFNCINNSNLVLLSDLEYNRLNKFRLKLRGIELQKVKNHSLSALEKLSEGLNFNIIQKDNIFAVSRPE